MANASPLRSFVALLEKRQLLTTVEKHVDPYLEIAQIQRSMQAALGPAILFKNVKNSSFPVVTGLFGSEERVSLAFNNKPERWIEETMNFILEGNCSLKNIWKNRDLFTPLLHLGKKRGFHKGVLEKKMETDLEKLPLLQLWPDDGGHFLTLPLVYTQNKSSENLGIYRMQRFDKKTLGLHFQIGKGGGFHYYEAERKNENLPVTVFLGGPVEWILSALAPLPENVSEILLASYLMRKKIRFQKLKEHAHPIFSDAEIVLTGFAKPHHRKMEGPFGDHFGFYSEKHPFPTFETTSIYHRKNAIFPAMVVGKPNQEDAFLGNYLQKLLKPLVKMAMPQIEDLWTYSECGFHNLASAVVKERYQYEPLQAAFRILGEGQLSLTKCLLLIDGKIDLMNFQSVLQYLLERIEPESTYLFRKTAADTLDYSDEKLNVGSKMVLIGTGEPKRKLPTRVKAKIPGVKKAKLFCAGCLVVEAEQNLEISSLFALDEYPLIILVDRLDPALKDATSFLWTVFTQLNPADDLHFHKKLPLLIDGRRKAHYPKEVLSSKEVEQKVTNHWDSYFEKKMEMGNADQAHVY